MSRPQVRDLLRLHVREALSWSPPSTGHAMEPEALLAHDITVFTAWNGTQLACTGALRTLCEDAGELKAMRAAPAYRGRGAGAAMLAHLLDEARRRGLRRVFLETGNTPGFRPAVRLYESFGFVVCEPFGDHVDDGFSICMKLTL